MPTTNRKPRSAWRNTAAFLMATSSLTPVEAFAICTPSPAVSGSVVTCTGTDTLGVGDSTQNDVKVTVSSGASVQNAQGAAVFLGDRAQVINAGLIGGINGVSIDDDGLVQNKSTGQIDVSGMGVFGDKNTVVLNEGTINASVYGVLLVWDGKLTNDGVISVTGPDVQGVHAEIDGVIQNNGMVLSRSVKDSGAFGFVFNAGGVVTNDGTVQVEAQGGTAYGVYAYGNNATLINNNSFIVNGESDARGVSVLWGAVTNTGNITVTSNSDAVGVQAGYELDLNNSGSILVTGGGRAVGYASGRHSKIVNSGSIIAEGQAGSVGLQLGGFDSDIIEVINSGTIKADVAITAIQNSYPGSPPPVHVTNTGTIDGDIRLYVQSDEIANMAGGKIIGVIDLGGGADRVINNGEIVGAINLGGGDDIYLKGSKGTQSGGSVTAGDGFDVIGYYADGAQNGILALSNGFEAAGVYADQTGVFTISSVTNGNGLHVLLMGSGSVINNADLSVSDVRPTVVMQDDGLDFENNGSISGSVAVQMGGDSENFINRGAVNGADDGVSSGDGSTIVNHVGATIVGGDRAIDVGSGTTIVNLGEISSPDGIGIAAVDGNDILNLGTINATGATGVGIMARNGNGSDLNDDGSAGITNFGTINSRGPGIIATQFGTITNTGTINSQTTGVVADNDFLVRNTGTIDGKLRAVQLGSSNDFLNEGTLKSDNIGIEMYFEHTADIDGDGDAGVINEGYIYSGGDGVIMRSDNIFENRNTIEAARDGISVITHNAGPASPENTIRNSAIVNAGRDGISIAQGDATIQNSGNIVGVNAIKGGSGVETITNSGLLDGSLMLGDGSDSLTLLNGSVIKGDIDGGAGVELITSAGVVTIAGKITNVESLSVSSGELTLELSAGSKVGDMLFTGGDVTINGAVATKATIGSSAQLSGVATITGSLRNDGILAPGNSIGTLSINGNYTQATSGELFVELGSASADKLTVTGTAMLDGTLSTGLVGTNLATLEGKSYSVLTAGSISGTLDTTGTIQEGFWTLDVQQTGNAVTVTVTDVDVTIGATAPVTGALAGAVGLAAPGAQTSAASLSFDGDAGDQQSASLDYDSMGDWESTAASFTGNWNALGDRTPAVAMPKTGSAEFEGTTRGELTETGAPGAFVVEGNVMLTADFAKGLVNADFTGMEKIDGEGVASAWIDFRARMSIADGTSEFAGTAGTDDGVWNGEARGGFFGDDDGMPGHAAGLWSISSPLGRALGGFTAKRR